MSYVANLDTMDPDDLLEYGEELRRNPVVAGNALEVSQWCVAMLLAYVVARHTEMTLMEIGEIEKAMCYTNLCEDIYDKLPSQARW